MPAVFLDFGLGFGFALGTVVDEADCSTGAEAGTGVSGGEPVTADSVVAAAVLEVVLVAATDVFATAESSFLVIDNAEEANIGAGLEEDEALKKLARDCTL